MARDNVTFIFRIDSAKAQQTLKALEAQVRKLGGEAVKTKQNVVSLGTGIDNSGQRAAASAVNFQTATQGMLNLSTAAVQTFTSISNLDRAHNRAKMSIIAVARAEDLLNNKQERLNQLRESGAASAGQLANMEREIATATADLTVKQEKQKIEQAAVNDIYMLFATNIANVTVSSMQTLAVLDKSDILLKKGRVIGQKLLTLTTWKSVMATRAETAARRENMAGLLALPAVNNAAALSYKTMTFAQRTATMATRAGTMALNGLKIALGPIGLIFIGISAAMVAYESNLGGIKDTINDLLGITDDFEQNLKNDRDATDELALATSGLDDKMKKLPTSYSEAADRMETYRQKLLEVAAAQKLAAEAADLLAGKQPLNLNQLAAGNFSGVSQPQKGKTFVEKIASILDPSTYLPSIAAQEQTVSKTYNQFKIDIENLPEGFTKEQVQEFALEFGTNKDFLNPAKRAEEYRAQQRDQLLFNLRTGKSQVTGMLGTELSIKPIRDFEKEFDPITSAQFLISDKPNRKYSDILGYEISDYEAGFLYSKAKRGGNISLTKEERQVVKLIDEEQGVDRDLLRDYDKNLRKLSASKSNREIVKIVHGFDFKSKIIDLVDTNEALRLGKFKKELQGFRNTTGGQTDALLELINQQIPSGRRTVESLDALARVNKLTGGLIAPDMKFGEGFFKSTGATAAYQIPEFGISAKRRRELDIKDANTNRLRWGGKLREGMSVWDEGAVVGGYNSAKEFSRASKRITSKALEEAQRFMFGFGFTGIKRYTGISDLRGKLNSIGRQAHERRTALESAGLGYKSFNINGLRYRHSRAEYDAYERERQSVIAFNNNQYAKAGLINMLEQDFGAQGFVGSALSLSSLQDEVSKQDELIKSIGLDRTEAFQIVDTAGRGREEIDDRIRFKDRMSSMSTGVSVL
jgi:hypothetical protein